MKLHANAALSFRQRERMVRRVVDEGWLVREAAQAAEVSARTGGKWVRRVVEWRECRIQPRIRPRTPNLSRTRDQFGTKLARAARGTTPQTRIAEPNEPCRRRDSNPRHADYDSRPAQAIRPVTTGFSSPVGHAVGHNCQTSLSAARTGPRRRDALFASRSEIRHTSSGREPHDRSDLCT